MVRLTGATAFSNSKLCFCRRMGPIALRGTLSWALLRKATSRNNSAGDLHRRVGRDFLSLAIELVEEPRPIMRLTTCTAEADPFDVSRPGDALRTLRASYRLNFKFSLSNPTNALSKVSSNEKDFRFPSVPSTCTSLSVVLALIVATLGVCEKTAAISFPVRPYSVITIITPSMSKVLAAEGDSISFIPFRSSGMEDPVSHKTSLSCKNLRIWRRVTRVRTWSWTILPALIAASLSTPKACNFNATL
mmetsp:Transcript_15099/g.32771  ORF Transcript_15099/g.32771 Transcript_15099/m.32771 type:complete len:247 (-) Transcript_15099:636-1376(-)